MKILSEDNPGTLVISEGRVPHGAYQAIYHKLTKKVEKTEKKFKGNYNIGASDIIALNQKIEHLLVQYKVQGVRCEIPHVAKKSASNSFSSIEKFTR
ncbi:hypothetical protein, partial [Gluconobacter sp.]|uniref:hypothetical protein n=1 Tax=Gluconobacter sp. TaxID=1876758 RepID=UPI0039EC5CF6